MIVGEIYSPTDLSLLTLITGYETLDVTQRVSSPWDAKFTVTTYETSDITTSLRSFMLPANRNPIFIVKRTDPVLGTTSIIYEGILTTLSDQTLNDGSLKFTVYSQGYTKLLDWRQVVPEEEYQIESDYADRVLAAYVTDNLRSIPYLNVQAPLGIGNLVERKIRFNSLLPLLQGIAEEGKVDFGVVGTYPPERLTLIIRSLWGTDRREDHSTIPTVFGLRYGNMINPILSFNTREEINYVYVGGEGQGEDRTIFELADPLLTSSPWGKKEGYTDAREETTVTGYRTVGNQYLSEHNQLESFTFDIKQTDGCRWLRDWELGDLITAYYANRVFHKKMVEINLSLNQNGEENIRVEMEDA